MAIAQRFPLSQDQSLSGSTGALYDLSSLLRDLGVFSSG